MAVLGKLAPGTVLQGRYQVVSILGEGGMSVVYLVDGLHLRRRLALKEMHDRFAAGSMRAAAIDQFQQEAATLAALDHPGIPKVLDFFIEDERAYLVMELVEGKTLDRVVADTEQYLSEQQVLGWMDGVLQTLDYLHSRPQPIVVRDIKPSNMILKPDDQVKLIDFGIAKTFGDGKVDGTGTFARGSGSGGFAPPEQYGESGTGTRADIYALGVTMYYLLTKTLLPESVDRLMGNTTVQPPSYYNPMVSKQTDEVIMGMLELAPHHRPSAAEVREQLFGKYQITSSTGQLKMNTSSMMAQTSPRLRQVNLPKDWDKQAPASSNGRLRRTVDETESDTREAESSLGRKAVVAVLTACVLALAGLGMLMSRAWHSDAHQGAAYSAAGSNHATSSPLPVKIHHADPTDPQSDPSPSPSEKPVANSSATPSETTVALHDQPIEEASGAVVALSAMPGDLRISVKTPQRLLVLDSQKINPPVGLGIGTPVQVKFQATARVEGAEHKTPSYAGSLLGVSLVPQHPVTTMPIKPQHTSPPVATQHPTPPPVVPHHPTLPLQVVHNPPHIHGAPPIIHHPIVVHTTHPPPVHTPVTGPTSLHHSDHPNF